MKRRLLDTLELIRFDRPVGTLLLFLPSGWSILLARPGETAWDWIALFLFGAFLTRSAGCVVNDLFDREIDKKVARTRRRPLADGRLSIRWAIGVFVVLTGAAASLLPFFSKEAILVAGVGYGTAVVYPLMKRFFPLPQLFMGIPFGATAPLMAWVQLTGGIGLKGVLVAAAGLFWATAYDLIYAVADLPDDRKAGVHSGAVTFGEHLWVAFLSFSLLTAILLWEAGQSLPRSGWLLWTILLFLVVVLLQSLKLRQGLSEGEPLVLFRSHVLLGALLLAGFWMSTPILV
ncbi:MAG: 4-hydroxybenzoate octaprenyltransferase [Nitrospiraceae bacterium]|jgi:4-hydroxybenzoate polyprenyltransferase|nr:4-hydroxybenzoate octaprenyltransferase [Nitrospiraceae bacterium]